MHRRPSCSAPKQGPGLRVQQSSFMQTLAGRAPEDPDVLITVARSLLSDFPTDHEGNRSAQNGRQKGLRPSLSFRRHCVSEQNKIQTQYDHADQKKIQGCKNSYIFAVFYNCSPVFLPEPGSPLFRMLLAGKRHVSAWDNSFEIELSRHEGVTECRQAPCLIWRGRTPSQGADPRAAPDARFS